jgi:O-acetyl-ADP-ribose deacetylase (regulator of RNase III)
LNVQIILTAVDQPLADAWHRFCGDLDGASVRRGSIFDVHADALVSPANSFGFMDGGIDALYTQRFGRRMQQRLQALIRERYHGELLVGAAEIVHTDDPSFPFVIAAPTMRVPMILGDSVNPYLAARAVFLLIRHARFADGPFTGETIRSVIKTVAFPGLGTGVGGIGPNTCARQMRAAIEEFVLGRASFPSSWADAQTRHQLLYTDRVRDLQKE